MSSITSPPAKILLTNSTKMSLNDRFTKLAKLKVPNTSLGTGTNIQANVSSLAKPRASARNKRLALQMANRPSVQAALKIKKRSIKQRLTFDGKARRNQNNMQEQTVGFDKSRLTFNNNNNRNNLQSRLGRNQNGVSNRFRNNRRGGLNRNGNNNLNNQRIRRVGTNNMNNSMRRRNNRNSGGRVNKRNSFNNKNRSFNKGSNNKKPAQNKVQDNKVKTKENLDMDLDQYMSKTKSHLDADLDSYMAQSNTN